MEIFLIGLATLVGTLSQTVTGFGFVFFLLPAMLAYQSPQVAVTTILLIGLTLNLLILAERRRTEILGRVAVTITLAALPGILLGAFILRVIAKEPLQILVGALIIAAAGVQLLKRTGPRLEAKGGLGLAVCGFIAGTMNSATSMGGPALALWMRGRRLTVNEVRDTLAACFLVLNVAGILAIQTVGAGSLDGRGLVLFAVLTPVIVLGHLAGRRLGAHMSTRAYRFVFVTLIITAGLVSIGLGTHFLG